MPGLVYTFERESDVDEFQSENRISTDAIEAIVEAINGNPEIHYEELTSPENPKPMIAVVFCEGTSTTMFGELSTEALRSRGVKIRDMQMTEGAGHSEDLAVQT